jgi:diguanylate cyclase
MSNKLQELESEADSLRSNLKVGHDKALSDALTGLPNRMAYDDRIMIEYNRWRRYKSALSLIVWDIDLFKTINDTYGHKAGDKTLALVAQLLSTNCRETDFIARYGGEEFAMLLPNTTSAQALIVAEKIRPIIANSGFNYHGESIRLTISCGISQFADDDQQENAFERADQALYLSKEQGRNKCSVIDK